MRRSFCLVASTLLASTAVAQDGPLNRVGQALDNAGRNIRYRVESEVARGQITAQERDLLGRVTRRIEWDKQLVGSALQIEARPDGSVVLRGSVTSDAVKKRAVDLVENTIGVTSVVDATAVVKEVKVIETKPAARPIELTPAAGETKVIVPPKNKVIVKP